MSRISHEMRYFCGSCGSPKIEAKGQFIKDLVTGETQESPILDETLLCKRCGARKLAIDHLPYINLGLTMYDAEELLSALEGAGETLVYTMLKDKMDELKKEGW